VFGFLAIPHDWIIFRKKIRSVGGGLLTSSD